MVIKKVLIIRAVTHTVVLICTVFTDEASGVTTHTRLSSVE